jgi:hypothetical protein
MRHECARLLCLADLSTIMIYAALGYISDLLPHEPKDLWRRYVLRAASPEVSKE